MVCPYCKSTSTKVIDKRNHDVTNSIRRRRECLECEKRFTTYERIEKVLLNVVKRDGRIEEFDQEKIRRGILKAVTKRNIPEEQIQEMIETIEHDLMKRDTTSVESTEIGKLVLKKLNKIDKLGALLFAAVYKEFKSLEDVERELKYLSE